MKLRNSLILALSGTSALLARGERMLGFELRESIHQNQEAISADPLSRDRVLHTHLQSSPLYGNSTDLQYFYVNIYVGSQR